MRKRYAGEEMVHGILRRCGPRKLRNAFTPAFKPAETPAQGARHPMEGRVTMKGRVTMPEITRVKIK